MTWLNFAAKPLAFIAFMVALLFSGMMLGVKWERNAWQAKWDQHLAADAAATEKVQAEQRAIEQTRQQSINKVMTDAQREIDRAATDAAAARASAGSLRDAADQLAARLAASEAGRNTCTAGASKAAAASARLLADVLSRANDRATVLAGIADQARARGLACEAAYGSLMGGE